MEGKSTMTALMEVINYIAEAIDTKECTAPTTLDLFKAFDLVDNEILLEKLQLYGFRGKQLEILQSFLARNYKKCDGITHHREESNYIRSSARFYLRTPSLHNIYK